MPRKKGSSVVPNIEKICLFCNKEYLAKDKKSKYCSNSCKCKTYWPTTRKKILPHSRLYYSARSRDKDLTITTDWILEQYNKQNGICALTGFPMIWNEYSGQQGLSRNTLFNVSLDRINQNLGYTPENVRLVCYQANMMRSILSDKELLMWCKAIIQQGDINA